MLFRREKNGLQILLLQLQKHRPVLYISTEGELGRKGRRRAKGLTEDIKREVVDRMSSLRWRQVPRARMAVTMSFHPKGRNPPALHNLVKFYLDELRESVFTDDRQVSYLQAKSYRPLEDSSPSDKESSRAFIKVERLADYKTKFDLYFLLLKEKGFKEYLKYHDRSLIDDDDDDDWDAIPMRWLNGSPSLSDEAKETLRRYHRENYQTKLLSINKISSLDRPGLPRWAKFYSDSFGQLRDRAPLTVGLGNLPLRGETNSYKDRIRKSLREFKSENSDLCPIVVPVELDVQVSSRNRHVGKDLDNIMRDISPLFVEEMLDRDAYLHGYRIYVADTFNTGYETDFLRLKLMPMNAASDFEKRMEKTFDIAQKWLKKELGRHFW